MKPSTRSNEEIQAIQEKKNYQDFVYQTNQSLQNLNNSIVSLSLLMEKAMAKSESDKRKILSDFEALEDKMESFCGNCSSNIQDIRTHMQALREDFQGEMEDRSRYVSNAQLNDKIKEVQDALDLAELQSCRSLEFTRNELAILKRDVKKICDDLANLPNAPDLKPMIKQLDEIEAVWKVNHAGVRRELDLIKKERAYEEKKFENIYTLIKRLQEAKL